MLMQNSKRAAPIHCPGKADPDPMRDYPVLCLVMDAGFAAHAAVSLWFKRWRSRQVLAALDNHQLRDIGLTRADVSSWSGRLSTMLGKRADVGDIRRRALADLDDSQRSNLSETGLRAWREARREHFRD